MIINTRNELDPRTLENSWKLPVLSSITTPPVSPVNGARYRIIATALGVWTGKENQIAIWDFDNQTWIYETYGEGSVLYDLGANDYRYVKTDGTWEQFDKIPLAISDVTGLQAVLDGKTPLATFNTHASRHIEGGADELTGQLNASALVRVTKNSGAEVVNKILNLIEGTNITLTVAESGDETDITISSTGGVINEFVQNVFRILGFADASKKVALDVDTLVSTGQVRTLKVQNSDGTIAILEGNQVFTALVQALTMIATNSLTTNKVILTNAGTNPVANGEIQMNGTTVKVMTDSVVRDVGRILPTDNLTVNGITMTLADWLIL